ncbi:Plant-drug/metabolite exporter [Trema orientale]|uniref:WAT1-related protein n=1 Tax=Trema orientale TaxID=63057 RepID=A0A2P5AWD9_TREOI|nr:Plant-drug/metabolite exporter [Trema orientale]
MEEQDTRRVRVRSKKEILIEQCTPYLLCIFCNICVAGFNVVSKVSLDQGMSRYVLLVYSTAFGSLASAPLALVFERKNGSKISLLVLRDVFFLGLLGDVLGRVLYFAGLEYTSPTFVSAMCNLIPSMTFIFAVLCRMEKMEISRHSSQAKIVGTVVAFGGAALMTLYKGISLISTRSLIDTQRSHNQSASDHSKLSLDKDWIKGSIMLFASLLSLSAYFVLQGKAVKRYPAPITLTLMTCISGTLMSTVTAAILDHKAASWRLPWNIALLGPLYNGVVIFAIIIYVQTLVTQKRGPVFMTSFRPLSTIIVAIMELFILGEALHLGSIVGAILIILGLYAILWGKEKEIKEQNLVEHTPREKDIDIKQENV